MLHRFPLALFACLSWAVPVQAQAPKPVAGPSASMDVSTRGMDEMIRALKSHNGRDASQAALVLMILRGMGKQGAGAQGPELHYKVELTPQGHVTINGLDVTAITEMVNRKK